MVSVDTEPAAEDVLWEIEYCRGSLDCWTAYAGRKVGPEEHWKGHLRRHPVTRRTPKRVYYAHRGRIRFTSRADLEGAGRSGYGRAAYEGDVYAAEPPVPEHWRPR